MNGQTNQGVKQIEENQAFESLKSLAPVEVFKLYFDKENTAIRQYVFNDYFEWLEGLVSRFKDAWIVLIKDPSVKEHFNRLADHCAEWRGKNGNDAEFNQKLVSCENAYRKMDLDGILCGIWNFYRWEAIDSEKNEWDAKFCYTLRKLTDQCNYFTTFTRPFGQPKWVEGQMEDSMFESDLEVREKSFDIQPAPESDPNHEWEKLHRVCEISYFMVRIFKAICDENQHKLEERGDGVFYKMVMLVDVPFDDIPDFIKNREETRFWEVNRKIEELVRAYGTFFETGLSEANECIFDDQSNNFIDIKDF